MRSYQPYWAALGHLLTLTGRKEEAHEALTVAIGLSTDPAVRRFLQGRLAELGDG
jgi:RNA polymerase sigma-70 factor (ECF subfamily)